MTALPLRDLPAALFGSAAARYTALTEWDARLRATLPVPPRIGFLSVIAGAGTTTLAEQVLRVIAARRADPVLVVDAASNGALASRLDVAPTAANPARVRARSAADAVDGLTRGEGWVALRPPGTDRPVAAWLSEAAPITRFFDMTITDYGARSPRVDLADVAALCDVVCLVSDAGRAAAEVARGVAPAIEALPEAPRVVVALVDAEGHGPGVARAVAADPRPVVAIPRDRGMAARSRPRSAAGREAVLRLAAALVSPREVA